MATTVRKGIRHLKRAKKITRSRRRRPLLRRMALLVPAFFVVNWIYHAVRKPVELAAPVSASFVKTPESTWRSYGSFFEEYSTQIMSPELLAAVAQVESNGNPVARTYWRWQWSWNPFEIYRPASSAVGMFQITDGTFAEAQKYCIRDHEVLTEGPWFQGRSCWFNRLYTRTIPRHSIELTSAYLHRKVTEVLAAGRRGKARPAEREKLAAVIHLCGAKRGESFAARRFRVAPGERCGSHSLKNYLAQIETMKKKFARLRETAPAT